MAELTDEERRNGWTEESLQKYLDEREKAQSEMVLRRKSAPPTVQNSKYSPHRWRRQ